jgi:surface antigen
MIGEKTRKKKNKTEAYQGKQKGSADGDKSMKRPRTLQSVSINVSVNAEMEKNGRKIFSHATYLTSYS